MQFTSTIILALLLALSSSTVTAAQKTSNLRSGRKLHEDNELNLLRELEDDPCHSTITIKSGDTCWAIHNNLPCGDWTSLSCDQAGKTCSEEGITKLIAGDSCQRCRGFFPDWGCNFPEE